MRQIRYGVFETNSSSTHSLTMCTQDEFDKFVKGELLLKSYPEEKFYTREEAIAYLKSEVEGDFDFNDEDALEELLRDYDFNDYEHLGGSDYGYETFEQSYTTPSGDKIVAFGYYGYNG